jgi:hypothetical protein
MTPTAGATETSAAMTPTAGATETPASTTAETATPTP